MMLFIFQCIKNLEEVNKMFTKCFLQVAALTVGLGAASLVYSGIRGGSNPEITDFKVNCKQEY